MKIKELGKNHAYLTDHMLLIGIVLAGVYWLLDSFMSLFLSSKDTLLEKLFGFNLDEVWMRITLKYTSKAKGA